jgi:hypothetical protein
VAVGVSVRVEVLVAVLVAVGVAVKVGVLGAVLVLVTVGVSVALAVLVGVLVGVAVSASMAQKPLRSVYTSPLMVPASGWPIVPPSVYTPPVLDVAPLAPPPSIVFHDRSNPSPAWAYTSPPRTASDMRASRMLLIVRFIAPLHFRF